MFCRSLYVLLAIVLSAFLRFTDSDYPFDIFKLFLTHLRHMQLFSVERKHWTLFSNMYASSSNKIEQEIIPKEGDVLIFYHIVLIDTFGILRIQYGDSFALESRTLSYGISIVDLTVNISQ